MQEELLNQPSAGMIISTIYWMKKHQRQVYDRIRYVMSAKDYISFRLCGEIGTEYTDAGATLAFSVKNYRWCTELFERLDIRKEIWAPVHRSFEIAGEVTARAAEETGLCPAPALCMEPETVWRPLREMELLRADVSPATSARPPSWRQWRISRFLIRRCGYRPGAIRFRGAGLCRAGH